MKLLNLGILAHVDAGKTTLTERLLFVAGVIPEFGSVDKGTTQTDTLALERQRGITIKTAVASFSYENTTINLIDTPGHPDFIAEVERALTVLDGAVLVLSAVEGVQPQTRVIMRALQRLAVPTLLFINKIDRLGADVGRTVGAITSRLSSEVVLMGVVEAQGSPAARFNAFEDAQSPRDVLVARDQLAPGVATGSVHPIYAGSALTGVGAAALLAGVTALLPAAPDDVDVPTSGQVFKVERSPTGEKIAYVRVFGGEIKLRQRLPSGGRVLRAVTMIEAFEGGRPVRQPSVRAGQIGRLFGLGDVRVGDIFGEPRRGGASFHFAPPTLEAAVWPVEHSDGVALRVALAQLAEQDPLINVRLDAAGAQVVSLYGEVQKEVLAATLATDFGILVTFETTTAICVERPRRTGSAASLLRDPLNPYSATVALRIKPSPPGSGIAFRVDFDSRLVPLYIYKTHEEFADAIARLVTETLDEGLDGWPVTDCEVTMTDCDYYVGDGKVPLGTEKTTAAHFRKLVPLVLRTALRKASTVVCEPYVLAMAEVPIGSLSRVLGLAAQLGGVVTSVTTVDAELARVRVRLSAARAQRLQRELPEVTGGEGFIETELAGYEPVHGKPPGHTRSDVGR